MANQSISSHVTYHNFVINPNSSFRGTQLQAIKKEPRHSLSEQKTVQQKSFDKGPSSPYPPFPLEIPKITRLVYKPAMNLTHGKRWTMGNRNSKSTIRGEENILPNLNEKQNTRNHSVTEVDNYPISENHKWEFSERVYWGKRKLPLQSVAIIAFESVIGDFYRTSYWDIRAYDMALCPGWIKGLYFISQKSYIAIITSLPLDRAEFLVELFAYNNVLVDAVYRRKGMQPQFSQDCSQILSEFCVPHSIVLTSIGLESNEITIRNSWDLLYEPSLSAHKRIITQMWPINSTNFNTPVVVLIPNPRAQDKDKCIPLTEVSKVAAKVLKTLRSLTEVSDMQKHGLKVFEVDAKRFKGNKAEDYKVVVFIGNEASKRPYLRYTFQGVKTQIELGKYQKLYNQPYK